MTNTGVLLIGTYTIPVTRQEYTDNFGDSVIKTQRVVGMDGGIDLDGDGASPSQIGRLQLGFWLRSQNRSGMDALRDQVKRLPSLGRQKIIYQPTDPNEEGRYIYGKINYRSMPEQKGLHTDLWQRVQLTIQAAEPVWKSDAGFYWPVIDPGTGSYIPADGTYSLATNADEYTFTSTPHEILVGYEGTATEYPVIALTSSGDRSLANFAIQRVVDGNVLDEVRYNDTLSQAGEFQELIIDARRKLVTAVGKRAWGPKLSYRHPDLMRFVSSSSETPLVRLNITGTVGGATGNIILRLWYENAWR